VKKILIPLILVLIGIGGGAFLGMTMKPEPETHEEEDGAAEHTSDQEKTEKEHAKNLESAALNLEGARDDIVYVDIPKQFVIPIMNAKGKRSLIVLQLQIEIDVKKAELATIHAPKLRDAFLRTLLELSDTGAFDDTVTSRETLEDIRYELKRAAESVLGATVYSVLIEQMIRQDL
jgi:hypothetical protein